MLDTVYANEVLNTLGLGEVTGLALMESGSSPVYQVERAADEPLVLKIFPDQVGFSPAKDAMAAAMLKHLDVPTTQYLLVDESKQKLPVRFAVTTYLPGSSLMVSKEHPDRVAAFRQMGAALRKLHSIAMPGYGFFDSQGVLQPLKSNTELMERLVPRVFAGFLELGGDFNLAKQLQAIVDRNFGAIVPASSGPVFAHNDLQPHNVLFLETQDKSLTLSGVIDYGSVCAADALSDLAKCLFCSEHDIPGSAEHILAGYGPIEHPDPEGAIRFYTLIHQLIMWTTLRRLGIIATPASPSEIIDNLHGTARHAVR